MCVLFSFAWCQECSAKVPVIVKERPSSRKCISVKGLLICIGWLGILKGTWGVLASRMPFLFVASRAWRDGVIELGHHPQQEV